MKWNFCLFFLFMIIFLINIQCRIGEVWFKMIFFFLYKFVLLFTIFKYILPVRNICKFCFCCYSYMFTTTIYELSEFVRIITFQVVLIVCFTSNSLCLDFVLKAHHQCNDSWFTECSILKPRMCELNFIELVG